MSKHHKHKEKSENLNVDNLKVNNLNDLMQGIDLSQVSSLLEQIDLPQMDMNQIGSLMSNLGLGEITEEQLNSLASNLNLGDLSNLDLSSINSENINSALNNLVEQLGDMNLNNENVKQADNSENDLSTALNEMLKSMEQSEAFQQLAQYSLSDNKNNLIKKEE